jgi:Fe-S-cluster containining protein
MTQTLEGTNEPNAQEPTYPAEWDLDTLRSNWIDHLVSLLQETRLSLPLKRIQYQLERSPLHQEIKMRWAAMKGDERLVTWKNLLAESERAIQEVLPVCVLCGECCRKGSPTLQLEDLDLLKSGKLPWAQLFTIRRGQPVRSPIKDEVSFLVDERIKIREKTGTQECVFFDHATDQCLVYADRPAQCRAQACWDPTVTEDLSKEPYLTRRDMFADIELLLDLIAEHDRRCSFDALKAAFERLAANKGETIDEVLSMLGYEDHFRHFLGEQLKIPAQSLDLVFGKSLADLVPLFGFRVEERADGTKCLVPEQEQTGQR